MKRIITAIILITLMLGCFVSPMTAQAAGKWVSSYELYIPGHSDGSTYSMTVHDKTQIVPYINICYTDRSWEAVRIENGSNVTFSSSKPSVATISKTGWLTAKDTGTTTITVKNKLNKDVVKFKVKVTVQAPRITAISTDDTRVTLKWSAAKNADGYEIQWDKSGQPLWRYSATVKGTSLRAADGLVGKKKFGFRVRARYKVGNGYITSAWSDTAYITVKAEKADKPAQKSRYTEKYKVVYSGGLYINQKCNRAKCTRTLMHKNDVFYVDPSTKVKSGNYYWAKAKYGDIEGWWVCISNTAWCKKLN